MDQGMAHVAREKVGSKQRTAVSNSFHIALKVGLGRLGASTDGHALAVKVVG